jgi:hypothetical protein
MPWIEYTHSIAFLRENQEIHREELVAPPELRDLELTREGDVEERIRLEWQTMYEQGSPECIVRYSPDGKKNWYVLATGVRESYYLVDTAMLPGGEACVFQVAASSGVRTSLIESEPIEIARKPARAYIISPSDGDTFSVGKSVVFQGFGFSPNYESSRFDDLVWHSNRDGLLGIGYQVVTAVASRGSHRITLSIPDGLEGEATASVYIRIV